jgi:hypothetical protein
MSLMLRRAVPVNSVNVGGTDSVRAPSKGRHFFTPPNALFLHPHVSFSFVLHPPSPPPPPLFFLHLPRAYEAKDLDFLETLTPRARSARTFFAIKPFFVAILYQCLIKEGLYGNVCVCVCHLRLTEPLKIVSNSPGTLWPGLICEQVPLRLLLRVLDSSIILGSASDRREE